MHVVIDPSSGKSSIKLTHTMIVNSESIRAMRVELEAAATAGDGEYDGWEAAAAP